MDIDLQHHYLHPLQYGNRVLMHSETDTGRVTVRSVALALLFFVAHGAAAAASSESTIGVEAYRVAYERVGGAPSLPKVIVYSPSGECVGVTTADQTRADDLKAYVAQALLKNRKACQAILSNEFGVTRVGAQSGTGSPTVQLIVMVEDFCVACAEYRRAFASGAQGSAELIVTNVDSSSPRLNPPKSAAKDCPTCSTKP